MNPVGRFLRWLGGFDNNLMRDYRAERLRATATGMLVIVVGAMAGAAATLTGHQFLHLPLTPAVALGISWALAIMSLDRWLLLVIKRQPTVLATLALATPRVALAVVAGLVIAKPIVLDAFDGEVTRQARWDKKEAVSQHLAVVDGRDTPPIQALTRTEDKLVKEIGTNPAGALANDPVYQHDVQQANRLSGEATKAFNAAYCELDGTCGTRHVGPGHVYDTKISHARNLQAQAEAAQQAANARAKVVNDQQHSVTVKEHDDERRQLANVRAQLKHRQGVRAADEQNVRVQYGGPVGLADRLEALGVIEHIHPSVGGYSLLLTLLLMLVDSAPALGKSLMLIGPKSAYERELDAEEDAAFESAELNRNARKQARETSAQEIVDQATLHRELWREELAKIVPEIIAVQRSVTEEAIQRWEHDIRAGIRAEEHAAGGDDGAPTRPPQQVVTHLPEHRRAMGRRRRP